jgi:hypothetical protein
MGSEGVSDGAFAGARRSRNAHAVPSAEARGNTSHNLWDLCTVPFDVRHELRQGPLVTSKHPLNEIHSGSVLHGGAQGCHPLRVCSGKKNRKGSGPSRRVLSDIRDDLRDGGTWPKDGLHTLGLEFWNITVRDGASPHDQHIVSPLGLE